MVSTSLLADSGILLLLLTCGSLFVTSSPLVEYRIEGRPEENPDFNDHPADYAGYNIADDRDDRLVRAYEFFY